MNSLVDLDFSISDLYQDWAGAVKAKRNLQIQLLSIEEMMISMSMEKIVR